MPDDSLNGIITNNTEFEFTYSANDTELGRYYNVEQSVDANASAMMFYAVPDEGSGTGSEGNVYYNFTDQNGNTQSISLYYQDPFLGSNIFKISVPPGMTGSATPSGSGSAVTVVWTVSGSPT